jgi:hypothetical protein
LDGFFSLRADGECLTVTMPFRFAGKELRINFATSAAGYAEFCLEDAKTGEAWASPELFGDSADRRVPFCGMEDLLSMAKGMGCKFVFGSDAHHLGELERASSDRTDAVARELGLAEGGFIPFFREKGLWRQAGRWQARNGARLAPCAGRRGTARD